MNGFIFLKRIKGEIEQEISIEKNIIADKIKKPWSEEDIEQYNAILKRNNSSFKGNYNEKDCKINLLIKSFNLFTPQEYQELLDIIIEIKIKTKYRQ